MMKFLKHLTRYQGQAVSNSFTDHTSPKSETTCRNKEAEALLLKNQRLEARIRELEASLYAAQQERNAGQPPQNIISHSLVDAAILGPAADSPSSIDSDRSMLASSNDAHEEESLIEAFGKFSPKDMTICTTDVFLGTLNIGPVGEAVFLGRNALSEVC
jgi:hypothetical protein